jgi:hypothetical protein
MKRPIIKTDVALAILILYFTFYFSAHISLFTIYFSPYEKGIICHIIRNESCFFLYFVGAKSLRRSKHGTFACTAREEPAKGDRS